MMETKEMIELLRSKEMVEIADRLKDLEMLCKVFIRARELAEEREYRKKYVEWWRKKNGKSDLDYPDFDDVYKDWFDGLAKE